MPSSSFCMHQKLSASSVRSVSAERLHTLYVSGSLSPAGGGGGKIKGRGEEGRGGEGREIKGEEGEGERKERGFWLLTDVIREEDDKERCDQVIDPLDIAAGWMAHGPDEEHTLKNTPAPSSAGRGECLGSCEERQ